jgi:hypothetical protein
MNFCSKIEREETNGSTTVNGGEGRKKEGT